MWKEAAVNYLRYSWNMPGKTDGTGINPSNDRQCTSLMHLLNTLRNIADGVTVFSE
jgi:hypothetical protein